MKGSAFGYVFYLVGGSADILGIKTGNSRADETENNNGSWDKKKWR